MRLISTEGPYLSAVVEVGGLQLTVMNDNAAPIMPGPLSRCEIAIFEVGSVSWESVFGGNQEQVFGLQQVDGWTYDLLGRIDSIEPTVIDCGVFRFEIGLRTGDPQVVGEFVRYRADRLDCWMMSST